MPHVLCGGGRGYCSYLVLHGEGRVIIGEARIVGSVVRGGLCRVGDIFWEVALHGEGEEHMLGKASRVED